MIGQVKGGGEIKIKASYICTLFASKQETEKEREDYEREDVAWVSSVTNWFVEGML